ncbi:MAG: hypothetical protein L0241_13285 [Planctomycetia bacterium]|nr:hypothetical protein [Planctomycetia bacterium]
MKLSAPPPPPPPPEQPAPGEQPEPNDPNANANANANAGPSADANFNAPSMPVPSEIVPTDPNAPAPVSPANRPLAWPSWFSGVDSTLVGLTVLLAFMAASFVARNSDVWLHLAAGKRLFAGEYTPGSDPFSYSATDRGWVNHSWLLDAIAYLLYGGKGAVLVAAKALVVAGAFGLLIAIRRPKFPLWPWAAVTCIAILAAAQYLILRPTVVSMLLLAVTLYLVFRMPHKPDSWRFPIAIGITFWLWASCDQWFFLGPLALALLIVGDLIQTYVLNRPEDPDTDPESEPLGRLPDTTTLAKALGIGLLACMLTPHHIRVWEFPMELVGAEGAEVDPHLWRVLFSPLDDVYRDNAGLGANLNGLAYAVLFVGGGAVLGFGVGRLRVSHIALWLGFAILSLISIYAIAFFAIVAVPLIASQLNAFSTKIELKTWGDPKSRLILLGSSGGRLLSVIAVCALCVLAYPGWVHPDPPSPVYARRVAWEVEPDVGMVKAAEQIQHWRENEQLPDDARGVIAHVDLANYIAWFAPKEKVFFNGRYSHHNRELADYLTVRKGLGLIRTPDELPNPQQALEVFAKLNAEYVGVHASPNDTISMRRWSREASDVMILNWGVYSPWYLDGRTSLFGWRPTLEGGKRTFAALRVDPVVLAFGPSVKPQPAAELKQPLVPISGWEDAFVRVSKVPSPAVDEALGWIRYKQALRARDDVRASLSVPVFMNVSPRRNDEWRPFPTTAWHQFGMWMAAAQGRSPLPAHDSLRTDVSGSDVNAMRAIPILALRAARRAIAHDPDHPDGYYALANVLADPDLPLSESERALGRVTALRQCLIRLPAPDRYKRGQYIAVATLVASDLAEMYLGREFLARDESGRTTVSFTGMLIDVGPFNEMIGEGVFLDQKNFAFRIPYTAIRQRPADWRPVYGGGPFLLPIDLAREALQKAVAYSQVDVFGDNTEEVQAAKQIFERRLKAVETEMTRYNDVYLREKGRGRTFSGLAHPQRGLAKLTSLIGETLQMLTDKDTDLSKEFGEQALEVAVTCAALQFAVGRLEDADFYMTKLTEKFDEIAAKPSDAKALNEPGLRPVLRLLTFQKFVLAGDYKAAGDLWESLAGGGIGTFDKIAPPGPTLDRALVLGMIAQRYQTQEPEKALEALLRPPLFMPVHPLIQPIWLQAQASVAPSNPRYQPLVLEGWTSDWIILTAMIRQTVLGQLQNEANFFYRRGVLSLLEGDIPAAKQRFQQVPRKIPLGWFRQSVSAPEGSGVAGQAAVAVLTSILDRGMVNIPEADMYLWLIELAERTARP